jgi:pilus assembly protein CpaE
MLEPIRIFIVDDSEEARSLVKRYMEFNEEMVVVGEASNGQETLEKLRRVEVDVVLMDINMPGMNGLEATELIMMEYPHIVVVIMSVQQETEYLKKAMISGAKEYIIKPFSMDVLNETIKNAYYKEKERSTHLKKFRTPEPVMQQSEAYGFFSTKGGVGKTLMAVNFALTLGEQTGEKVALVDLDLLFGDIGMMTNLKPVKTIIELIDDMAYEKVDSMKEFLIEHSPRLDILLSPKKPEFAEYVNATHIQEIFKMLRRMYRYIVVDFGTNFDEATLAGFDEVDKLLFVSTVDLLSVKNAKLGLDVMSSLNYSADKVSVILNRSNVRGNINLQEVRKLLRYPVIAEIPEDPKGVLESINMGRPLALEHSYRGNKILKALRGLVKTIKEEVA